MEMKQLKMTTLTPVKKTFVSLYAVLSGKILTRNLKGQQRSSSSRHRSRKLGQKRIMLAGGAKGAALFSFLKKEDKQE